MFIIVCKKNGNRLEKCEQLTAPKQENLHVSILRSKKTTEPH